MKENCSSKQNLNNILKNFIIDNSDLIIYVGQLTFRIVLPTLKFTCSLLNGLLCLLSFIFLTISETSNLLNFLNF
jgi:hypothetical protein